MTLEGRCKFLKDLTNINKSLKKFLVLFTLSNILKKKGLNRIRTSTYLERLVDRYESYSSFFFTTTAVIQSGTDLLVKSRVGMTFLIILGVTEIMKRNLEAKTGDKLPR